MYKVLVLCDAGVSSNKFLDLMKYEIEIQKLNCELKSGAISDFYQLGKAMDMVLLGPQVRFNSKKIKEMLPSVEVEVISVNDFSTLNVVKIVGIIKERYSKKKESTLGGK